MLLAVDDGSVSSHSLKSTCLSWAAKAGMPRESRRLLGRHADAVQSADSFYSRIASTVGRLPRALGVAATNISPAEEQVATDLLDAVEMLRLASFVGGAWKKIVCVVSLLDDDSPTFQKKNGTNKLLKIIDFLRKKDGKHLGVCRAWSRFFSHPTRKIWLDPGSLWFVKHWGGTNTSVLRRNSPRSTWY